jgi:Asp/Glu/hydantoin racemase
MVAARFRQTERPMPGPRIALIHATPVSIEPSRAAFAELWPEARTTNLLDDSLSADLAAAGKLDARMVDRFRELARYVAADGAEAILFSCSAFGPAIEAVQRESRLPVLKPNEAAFEAALDKGPRVAIVVTFGPSAPALQAELEAAARARGMKLEPTVKVVPGAMEALGQGRGEEHDVAIADAIASLPPQDAIVLGQFSMSRAHARIKAKTGKDVLTTPRAAVEQLMRRMRG